VDTVCREKMCEWSYRVCDHFAVEREIVAIAFSYLDRFTDRCTCDRTTFKLAAVTSLFMANKIFNTNKIPLRRFIELSKGEFEKCDILEMEITILQTLAWQVNPPTLHCFVEHLCAVLPSLFDESRLIICVYQRAIFLAELALYDSTFVEKKKPMVAVAAVLNAIEGLEEGVLTELKEEQFVQSIETSFGISYDDDDLKSIRRRLWYVYSLTAQCRDDEVLPSGYNQLQEISERSVKPNENGINPMQLSPVCVIRTGVGSCHTKL
jgi:Cyclin, N-terminal domain/Cyclin, C-terminal domain